MAALMANPGTCGTRAASLNRRAPTGTVTHPYINRTESDDLYALLNAQLRRLHRSESAIYHYKLPCLRMDYVT